jgi:hypothetical protein
MEQRAFNDFVDSFLRECASLLSVKGHEYAGSFDRLANFKRGADLTGCTPEQVAFVYLSKHYDAIATYVREGQSPPSAELIESRLQDLLNYVLLLAALIQERSDSCDTHT